MENHIFTMLIVEQFSDRKESNRQLIAGQNPILITPDAADFLEVFD